MDTTQLGINRDLDEDYEAVLGRLPEALQAEGFGVLTEIDVRDTLKVKIGVDFRRYKILGACNPKAAHEVLQAEPQIGLLLPCNVVVYELEPGRTRVAAFDPMSFAGGQGSPAVAAVAADVQQRLQRVIASLA